jgi:hypothetical protein
MTTALVKLLTLENLVSVKFQKIPMGALVAWMVPRLP